MTTQQPAARQGANAWKMGTILNLNPSLVMGFFFYAPVVN